MTAADKAGQALQPGGHLDVASPDTWLFWHKVLSTDDPPVPSSEPPFLSLPATAIQLCRPIAAGRCACMFRFFASSGFLSVSLRGFAAFTSF